MEQNNNLIFENKTSITTLDGKFDGLEKRVTALEKASDVLMQVQLTLGELMMQTKHLGEKFTELKTSINEVNEENKKQHKELSDRLSDIESKPGKRWETVVGQIIALIVAVAAGYLFGK